MRTPRAWFVALPYLAASLACSSASNDSTAGTEAGAADAGADANRRGGSDASLHTDADSGTAGHRDGGKDAHEAGPDVDVAPEASLPPPAGSPLILYTDVVSGPTTGGEAGNGAYLTIFGKNFGASGLGTTVKVTIGGAEVVSYLSLGATQARPDIEQIVVQVGPLGSPTPGSTLPVVVTVGGLPSNANQTFTPNPGRMLFVDNVSGDDATAVPGDITHPFKHVQLVGSSTTAAGVSKPGDTIVLRGKGTVYDDLGYAKKFVEVINFGGSKPTGAAGTGYLAFIGYPGETVNIVNGTGGVSDGAAFSSFDHTASGYTGGSWVTIANLHIEGDGTAGVIALQIQCDHWRIVNNELDAPNTNGATVLAAGINGNGTNIVAYGNTVHDITGSGGENHGFYVDGDGSYDLAYNQIYNVASGYGIQAYNNGDNGSTTTHDVHVHHNYIHDVMGKGCLNIADGSTTGFEWWDNVCANINLSCLRIYDTGGLSGAQVFNNTFYQCGMGDAFDGAIDNDSDGEAITSAMATIVNNIVWPSTGVPYTGGSGNGFGSGVFSHNDWYNGTGQPTEPGTVTGNPGFVAAGTDFHLAAGSPAIGAGSSSVSGLVTTNYDGNAWAPGTPYDIGAY